MTTRRKRSPERKGLRLLSYARVSAVRGREGPGFISEADQFARNRAYADAYGHRIVEEAGDRDVSGGEMRRPVFDRYLAMIERSEADGLIVAKLDRFARSNVGALEAVETIENAGGTLISVAEQLDASTGAGRFLRTILFAAAEWERDRIGDAWYAARSSAVERGIHVAPFVPPGYVRGPKTDDPKTDRRLTPHPEHAETIRRAFEMAAEGASSTEIADWLNERELPTVSIKKGQRATFWQASRISRLLRNRVFLGEARSGSGIEPNEKAHEPLVDEETFLLAQHRRTNGSLRRPNRSAKRAPSTLSGIARCAGCSFAMKSQEAGKSAKALYRCTTTSVHGRCQSPSTIAKARLEEYVLDAFVAQADTLFVASRVDDDDELQGLLLEAEAAERSYRNALTNIELRRRIGDADHDQMIARVYDEWRAKLAEVEKSEPRASATIPEGVTLRALVEDLRARGENEELRSLLADGIDAVFVRPAASRSHSLPVADRVHIVWRGTEKLELPRRGRRFEPRAYHW